MNQDTVTIDAVAHGGDGICRIDGQVCFVPGALPQDTIKVRITRRSKGVLWGTVEQVVEPSPYRAWPEGAAPCCPWFGYCGGCGWLHFTYPAQAEWKCRIVKDCLQRIGGVEIEPLWVETPELRLGYRTRAEFHSDGERVGFYAPQTRQVIDVEQCPLCHPRLNEALSRLRSLRWTGDVEIVVNPEGDSVLVWTRKWIPAIQKTFAEANTPRDNNRFGFLFDGAPIVNGTFSQSSLLLNRTLQGVVRCEIGQPSSLLDLYCGNGNFSLSYVGSSQVRGIDHSLASVKAAAEIAKGAYEVGDERLFVGAISDGGWDVVLVDPPRTGAKALVPALIRSDAHRLVYVSCDPATLARDLRGLVAGGWKVASLSAVDMFPHTPHVETVCRLER